MVYFLSFFLLLAFVFPVGLYPFQDFTRDYLSFASIVLIFSYTFWQKKTELSYPCFILFFPAFLVILLLNFHLSSAEVAISFNLYLLAFVFCLMTAFSVSSVANSRPRSLVSESLAMFLLVVFILSSIFGLLRFYGVLGQLVPIVTVDGDRLIGPMGQPNLMAIVAALGLGSLLYLYKIHKLANIYFFYITVVLVFFVGSLTGSRSWYVAAVIVMAPYIYYTFKGYASELEGRNFITVSRFVSLILIFLFVSLAAPKVDSFISDPLIESGYLNRMNAVKMYEGRSIVGSSGRLGEWQKVVSNVGEIEQPWFGYGVGRYGVFSNKMSLQENEKGNGKIWNHSHNIFLNFLIEWGVFGLILILAFFSYLIFVVVRSKKTVENCFLISIIAVLGFHNLVEFSLWYLPFLAIFVSALTLLDKKLNFDFSHYYVRRFISVIVMAVFIPLGAYILKDVHTITKVMYKGNPDFIDQIGLRDASMSSLVGNGAVSVMILRFSPPNSGFSTEFERINALAEWRPEPLYLVRRSVLLAALGNQDQACQSIEATIRLYPDAVSSIQDELMYLSTKTDLQVNDYFQCIASGVGKWVN